MKKSLYFIVMMLLAAGIMVSGCAKKNVKTEGQGSNLLVAEDIPLDEANINFKEASGIAAFQDIYFDYDKSDVREDAKPVLEQIVVWMKEQPAKHVMVEGHCDERGSKEYNLALGEQRALSVRRFIANGGIEPKRVHTISYGEEKPEISGHNESAWSKNRRGHFLISE